MLSPSAETYLGDDTLRSLLEEIEAPISVFEVKAIILGAINNVALIPPSGVIEAIVGNPKEDEDAIEFKDQDQAMRFYGQIFSCWNSMNDMKSAPIIFSPIPRDPTFETVVVALKARCEELSAFLTFLDAAEYLEDFTSEEALDAFSELSDYESKLHEFIDSDFYKSENFQSDALAHLNELTTLWDYVFPILKKQLAHIRVQNMSPSIKQSSAMNFDFNKPSRNSPCTCGSGKKFKRCCGRDT